MSNRGRQNVASFLALDLDLDWRDGAWWFESCLLDYDVASNWGNWVAAAGLIGGRLNKFNITKQSKVCVLRGGMCCVYSLCVLVVCTPCILAAEVVLHPPPRTTTQKESTFVIGYQNSPRSPPHASTSRGSCLAKSRLQQGVKLGCTTHNP